MRRHLPAFLIALAAALLWLAPVARATYPGGSTSNPIFGDGYSGAVTIPAGVATLTSEPCYTTLEIQNGATLNTAGCRIRGTVQLIVRSGGTIAAVGADATNATQGTATNCLCATQADSSTSSCISRYTSTDATTRGPAGLTAAAAANGNNCNGASTLFYCGAPGGAGGASAPQTGGTVGNVYTWGNVALRSGMFGQVGSTFGVCVGGEGGGGGAKSTATVNTTSGAGGCGGGLVWLAFPMIVIESGGTITVAGGRGGDATTTDAGNAGGRGRGWGRRDHVHHPPPLELGHPERARRVGRQFRGDRHGRSSRGHGQRLHVHGRLIVTRRIPVAFAVLALLAGLARQAAVVAQGSPGVVVDVLCAAGDGFVVSQRALPSTATPDEIATARTGALVCSRHDPELHAFGVIPRDVAHAREIRCSQIDATTASVIALNGFAWTPPSAAPGTPPTRMSLSVKAKEIYHGLLTADSRGIASYPIVVGGLSDLDLVPLQGGADVLSLYGAAMAAVQTQETAGLMLKAQVQAATTVTDVIAVVDSR